MRLLGASSSLTTTAGRRHGFAQKLHLPPGQTAQPRAMLLQKTSLPTRLLQSRAEQRKSRVTSLPAVAHTKDSLGCSARAWMR